jgi:RTX calcium-binding nonapeptide repeat (4 copies)
MLVFVSASVAAADLNTVKGNNDNNITPKPKRMLPDCDAKPCTGDLKGTKRADLIFGYGGWDWVHSGDGDDVIYGGPGMDQLYANDGDDVLIGGSGHDHLFGDSGDDYLNAADGHDEPMHVEAAFGDRELQGQTGNDTCVLDEDVNDGIVIGSCEKLVIRPVPGLDGETPWGKTSEGVESGRGIEGYVTPDTYRNVG